MKSEQEKVWEETFNNIRDYIIIFIGSILLGLIAGGITVLLR